MPKPRKTAAQARASHLAMQARRDGLARLRAGKVANFCLVSGEKVRVRPIKEGEALAHKRVLLLHRRRLIADVVHDKDCELAIAGRALHRKDVFGVVL